MAVTLSGDSGVSGVSGDATTPSYRGSDADTGIFYPSAGVLGISTNGSERMRIDTSGNVGIGTNPTYTLDIAAAAPRIRQVATTGTNNCHLMLTNTGGIAYVGLDSSAGGLGAAYALTMWHGGNYPLVFGNNNTEKMRIDSAGNVGIGTAGPGYILEVSKSQNLATEVSVTNVNTGTAAQARFRTNNSGSNYGLFGQFGASYTTSGVYRQDGVYLFANGTGGLTLVTGASQPIYFATNNTEAMRIDSSGNVGIGNAPIDKLSVEGSTSTYARVTSTNNSTRAGLKLFSKTSGAVTVEGHLVAYGDVPEVGFYSISNHPLTLGTNNAARMTIDGSTGTLTSQPTYDNTAAGSTVVVTSAGLIRRTSSSLKYKKDIETLDPSLADNALANLRPVWYRSKEANGDDKDAWSHIGLIAEEVDLVEPRLVRYRTVDVTHDEEGKRVETVLAKPEPEDVDYGRLSVLLLDVVQRQQAQIADLTAKINELAAEEK